VQPDSLQEAAHWTTAPMIPWVGVGAYREDEAGVRILGWSEKWDCYRQSGQWSGPPLAGRSEWRVPPAGHTPVRQRNGIIL
jgi:hypothetical protein